MQEAEKKKSQNKY